MRTQKQVLRTILIIALSSFYQMANAQWSQKSSGFGIPNRAIHEMIAVDRNVAWAMGFVSDDQFGSELLTAFTRTTDGGKHWMSGSITERPTDLLLGIAPVSATTCWALTVDSSTLSGSALTHVMKTTNGGITWTEQFSYVFDVAFSFFADIYFFNSNEGLVFGDTTDGYFTIYTTDDGGANWTRVPEANMPVQITDEGSYILSGTAIGDTFWTVSGSGRVWRTTDKGHHWIANATDVTEIDFSNIKMRDAMNGLWGVRDELYRTTDGGITWNEFEPEGTWFTYDLSYVPGTAGTWVSTGGDVNFEYGTLHGIGSSYSLDDGNTWITIDTGIDHLALAMANSYTGFCGGFNKPNGNGGVYRYTGPALGYACDNEQLTMMCLNGESLCVPHNHIKWVLKHGGVLGDCGERKSDAVVEINSLECFPNPLSASATVSWVIPSQQNVSLQVFDVQGRLIRTLADEVMSEGVHMLTWDAGDENGNAVSAGIYFLRMKTQSEIKTITISVAR